MSNVKNKIKDLLKKESKLSKELTDRIEKMRSVNEAAKKVSQEIQNERAQRNR